MKIFKNVLLAIVAVLVSYCLSYFAGEQYGKIFTIGGWIDMTSLIGWPLAYIFFLTLLFIAFSGEGRTKYWWIGILLIPALIFEIYIDPIHIYFPIILGLAGWLVGLGIQKLIAKLKK